MTDETTDTTTEETTAADATESETADESVEAGAEAEEKGRHTDSKIMILITDSDAEDESVNFEGPFDSKGEADRWIKENAEEGYDYNVARLWPTMQVKVVTTRTVTVVD